MLPINKLDESQKWELASHKALDLAVKAMVALSMTQGVILKSTPLDREYSYSRKTDIGQGLTRFEKFTFRILEDNSLELINYLAKDEQVV